MVDFVDCVDCVDRAAEPRDSGLAAVAGWGPRHGTVAGLDDEHAVAEAVEAVALADGLGVGVEDALAPGEGGDHHEERRLREVEVREHRVHGEKVVGRVRSFRF